MSRTHDILDGLIGFDTVSAKSNLAIIDWIEALLRDCGFRLQRLPDETGQKAGLYAEIGPSGEGGILLSGHTDVVPVDGQDWSRDPFRMTLDRGRLYGRGTTDMKGYLASMLAVAERAAEADLAQPLKLVFSYDEEVGCVGIRQMLCDLQKLLGQPRACFVGEPTDMGVAVGHKGKAALRAVCYGQSGHSALAPRFVNALHLAAAFIGELRAVQDDLALHGASDQAYDIPYSTVHVGRLSGGAALNIVPDRAEISLEFRHLATDHPKDIRARIDAAAARAVNPYARVWEGARIELEEINAYPGLNIAENAQVVKLAQAMAQSNAMTKVAFGTEAGFFESLGIPTVVCGPGSMEGQGHKPDEYVSVEQLAACDAMMERILVELSRPAAKA